MPTLEVASRRGARGGAREERVPDRHGPPAARIAVSRAGSPGAWRRARHPQGAGRAEAHRLARRSASRGERRRAGTETRAEGRRVPRERRERLEWRFDARCGRTHDRDARSLELELEHTRAQSELVRSGARPARRAP